MSRSLLAIAVAGAWALGLTSAAVAQTQAQAQPAPADAREQAFEKAFEAAVQQARATLPVFWMRMAENPGGPDDYGLKVALRNAQGGMEQIWLSDIKRNGDHIVGRLNYDPDNLPGLHRLQIVPIPPDSIIDWTFKEGRKRYGHYTTRVLAKDNPDGSAKTLAALSDDPLPADARGK